MDELPKQSSMIKTEARRLGFDGCGISHAEKLNEDADRLAIWLKKGYHATMTYMENHAEMRVNPEKLVDGAQSVISVILNYYPPRQQEDPDAPVLSKYAYGKDYHGVIRDKLRNLLKYIQTEVTPAKGRGFVDSAPVLDRAWGARAGLGWIGKNTNLISPSKGSFFFIGSLIIDKPLYYDKPIPDFCGDCSRCMNACPTKAIVAPQVIDARKCISYLTIENRGSIDPVYQDHFHNRVFGCDICQDVCPWNRKAIPHQVKEFEPSPRLLEMTREEWHSLNQEQYNHLFSLSAVERAGFQNLRRNLSFISAM